MHICYHTGNTGPGSFHAFMASDGKHALEDYSFADPCLTIRNYITNNTIPFASSWVTAAFLHLAAPHPILFRPSAQHCEALEHVTPNFTIDQYTQPYPVCIVEFPTDYAVNRLIPLSDENRPLFAIVVKVTKEGHPFLAIAVFGTIHKASGHFWAGKDMSVDLNADVDNVACAALNFLMMVDDGDVTEASIPPRRVKRKHRRHAQKQKPTMRVFTLQDQSIKLFSTCDVAPDYVPPDEPNGTPKRPHWRKGHWRFYESGKRVRINPILVNKDKLGNVPERKATGIKEECREVIRTFTPEPPDAAIDRAFLQTD